MKYKGIILICSMFALRLTAEQPTPITHATSIILQEIFKEKDFISDHDAIVIGILVQELEQKYGPNLIRHFLLRKGTYDFRERVYKEIKVLTNNTYIISEEPRIPSDAMLR